LSCRVRPMYKEDIAQVSNIDREAFPTMWPPVNFQRELTNRLAHYLVVSDGTLPTDQSAENQCENVSERRSFWRKIFPFREKTKTSGFSLVKINEYVTGFVGMWLIVDEAHIINIAVREVCRGKGLGELLLISSIDTASSLKANVVTLEVRVSNSIAQNLYNKYGFNQVGLRKKYYTDNNEDALIMTTDIITTEAFKERFQKLKEAHFQKLKNIIYHVPFN
jgi:[ribosomal protein S18]-alanine N-acetyltransferase